MQNYINKNIEGDCIEILKNFPDNFFDLIFADPPYNLQLPNCDGAFYVRKLAYISLSRFFLLSSKY